MHSPPSIPLLDELAAEAWPAPVVEEVDGWRLRWGDIVCGTDAQTAFAQIDGVAVGRAALSRGWVGIFAMSTLAQARRRGAGRAILHAMARWALDHGAEAMYLQVEESNAAARRLYASAGFSPLYAYHYRTLPT